MKTDISLWFGVAAVLLCGLAGQARAETIAVITDLNGSYGSTRYHARVDAAVAAIIELQPDVVLSAGDMVAGQRQPLLSREQVRHLLEGWDLRPSLTSAPAPALVVAGRRDPLPRPARHPHAPGFRRGGRRAGPGPGAPGRHRPRLRPGPARSRDLRARALPGAAGPCRGRDVAGSRSSLASVAPARGGARTL